jgi:hypothetical protein
MRWRVLVLVAALALAPAEDARACSCVSSGPPCQEAWSVDAVFSGTVHSIQVGQTTDPRGVAETAVVRFTVDEPFINVAGRSVDVTVTPMSTCAYRFQTGRKYLIYARKLESGVLSTSICSRTRPIEEAAEDLRYLRSNPSSAKGARIYGTVTEWRRDPAEEKPVDYGPMAGLTVTVGGATVRREIVTDAHGRNEIRDLPAGRFLFALVPPAGFDARGLEYELEIQDARACRQMDFNLSPIAAASGSVVDAQGRPVAGLEIDAVAAELAGFNPAPLQTPVRTDERGMFRFEDLPPGTYVFGVNLTVPASGRRKGVPLFLPGTSDPREATAIELKPGDRREIGVLRLVKPPQDFAFFDGFDLPALFRATACRTSALKAASSTSSPSWMSIARRAFPSRLELKRRAGSFSDAPLGNVSFTTFL